ncbi:hypothetical protein P691DRAFT_314115 [Macrolepiota fuliginosa MF-IS2]|uniref:F-box domain-containing protein n=1 Tax=Macrolepiota fuliginosa MF-IS2 TaxID=1400762 RepID=A0A9P6C714_9AGAR|nr:hypothetical protein P691DRAFT_314115 [Macrolepiota fuliginosa MF-IS2]
MHQAPMRTLLPELCGEIFSYCVHAEDSSELQRGWDVRAPVTLSNVCRRWYDMVLNNPTLWTKLCIRLGDKVNHVARAQLWISRSNQLPIDVTLKPSTLPPLIGIPDAALPRFLRAVKWLSQHIHRAKTLTIEPGIPIVPFLLSDGNLPAMPYLQRLILDTGDKDDASIVQRALEAPLLRELRLRDLTSMTRVLRRSLDHLRVLVITYSGRWVRPSMFGNGLSSCTQLVDLTVNFPSEPIPPSSAPILLPEVRRLHLCWRHQLGPTVIIEAFRVPKLEHLILAYSDTQLSATPGFAMNHLKELFVSAPDLQRLTLSRWKTGDLYNFSTALEEAQNLAELEILGCQRGSLLLMSLAPPSGELSGSWLCPRIRRLMIDSFDKWDVRPILDFVRRRMCRVIDGTGVLQSPEYSYIEELELPRNLDMLDFQSRVYLRNQLGEIGTSGRVRIVGSVVG